MHCRDSDRYQRKRIFSIAVCLFLLAAAVSPLLAQDEPEQTEAANTLFMPVIQDSATGTETNEAEAGELVETADHGSSPTQLRRFIDRQVGGIEKLIVPADADIPTPLLPDGTRDPRFITTEAKRYLGKQLFHDPVRAVRIRPQFGGIPATAGTSSCGSCHLGETASRAGTLFNFAAGGEGRGYTDADGNFIARRRPNMAILPRLRDTPLFPGDLLVDGLPTLQDVYRNKNTGAIVAGSPALQLKLDPNVFELIATGRLDALDSVGRNAPGVLGAAFNNRLLQGGFAGEPNDAPGGLNPFGFVAQESVALLLLDAHRMLEDQSAVLQSIPAFVKLFREAFPEEAAQADAANDLNLLINDGTVLRATASFMRSVVTRDTAWDHFLAGDNSALTPAQRRGAKLFFTSATEGGAGCYTCHSGPMLNKQVNDPDVTGAGAFVDENFYNLGLADHPLQTLNQTVRGPNFRDDGRIEITGFVTDTFEFRVLTLRQLKDSPFFMHNGSFTSVRDVVEYFNAGVPQDAEAAAASTFTTRFSYPRGPGSERGLGLDEDEVDDLTEFLEEALHDPTFVDTFMLTTEEMTYSKFRPDLAVLGAKDGFPISGLPQDNNDPLSRRDMGLEFLDVTAQISTQVEADSNVSAAGADESADSNGSRRQEDEVQITNSSASVVDTHLLIVVQGLPAGVQLTNASGMTSSGEPYIRVFLHDGVLLPGKSIEQELRFKRTRNAPSVNYTLKFLSGQGNP